MKRITIPFVLIFMAYVINGFGQEVLLNGNFESWDDINTPTSWTHVENVTQESTAEFVHGGTYSAKHLGGTSDLGQTINGIIPGDDYDLTIWYKVTSGDGTDARIWCYWRTGTTTLPDNAAELRGPNNSYFANNGGVWSSYSVTVTAPAAADNFYFEVRTYSGATVYWDDFSFSHTMSGTPTITVSETSLTGFNYELGNGPSAEQTFTVEGFDLTDDITVNPSINFEISLDNSTYQLTPITLTQTGGVVSTTTIYTRLQAGLAATTYVEDILITSPGATDRTVTCTGTVETPVMTTLPYFEPFNTDLGDCYVYSVSGPLETWVYSSYSGNGYADMNGFNTGDTEEDWLILPGINFDGYSNERMTFDTWYQYGTDDEINYLKVLWSPDYYGVGDPSSATWNEISYTQPADPNIYSSSGLLDLSGISGSNVYIAFKYHYEYNEPSTYRWWQVDNISIYQANLIDVTFQVNMEEQTVTSGVFLAGEFNGWNPTTTEMFDGDADQVYTTTIQLYEGLTYQFKYVNSGNWESIPSECEFPSTDNRYETVGSSNYSIPVVCFNSCTDCGTPDWNITFQVDMKNESVSGDVYLAGDFNGWSDQPMINSSGSIYQLTVLLEEGSYHEYKFKNGPGGWEGFNGPCVVWDGGNRFMTTPTGDLTLDLVCFNSCEACPVADFVIINEVDSDTESTDVLEFIELYDGGFGNTDLTGLVVILYNGSNDASYAAYDLDGFSTDANGYFLLGNSGLVPTPSIIFANNFLQNGADAVALYLGDDTDFPNGTPVTNVNILDALVYDTNDGDDTGLLDVLTPGQPQINEGERGNPAGHSNQRIPNGSGGQLVTTTYDQSPPTPGALNVGIYTDWTGAVSNEWSEAGNWHNGVPTDMLNVEIPDVSGAKAPFPVISTSGAICNQLFIAANAQLNIGVNGDLTTNGLFTNNGTFTIENDGTANVGSYIDNGGTTGSGAFNFYREMMGTSSAGVNHGWHYISMPTNGISSDQLIPDYYLNWWDEPNDTWVHVEGGDCSNPAVYNFDNGKGYSVLRDLNYSCPNPVGNNLNFGGPFSNMHNSAGTYSVNYTDNGTFDGGGWNLFGNPYTSPIDIFTMVTDGDFPTSLNGAVYIYKDVDLDYAESAGGVGEIAEIPATQGFFMQATSGGLFNFENGWRTHNGSDNFYKESIADVLALQVSGNDYSDKIYIRFLDEASTGFDRIFDAHKLLSNAEPVPQIYTVSDGNELAINTLPVVPLVHMSFVAGQSGTYTIEAIETSEFGNIVLEDGITGAQVNLLETSYTFNYIQGSDPDRFIIHFTPLNTPEHEANNIRIWSVDENVYVNATEMTTGTVEIFNMMGQKIMSENLNEGLNTYTVNGINGYYIVKVLSSNAIVTGKVIIK
ncbi:MAG: T9SS type A sorting domain-containing protein [Bacteroidales bacterium]|nr:T9SS type A sorting domain-containing protein [Bacteroidales bacterium]